MDHTGLRKAIWTHTMKLSGHETHVFKYPGSRDEHPDFITKHEVDKMYRRICIFVHPDKVGPFYTDLFREICESRKYLLELIDQRDFAVPPQQENQQDHPEQNMPRQQDQPEGDVPWQQDPPEPEQEAPPPPVYRFGYTLGEELIRTCLVSSWGNCDDKCRRWFHGKKKRGYLCRAHVDQYLDTRANGRVYRLLKCGESKYWETI